MRKLVFGLAGLLLIVGCAEETPKTPRAETLPVVHFPKALDKGCRDGEARAYDECGSQMRHYRDAIEEARKTGKVVLVSLGAEWCIWCHVLDAHLNGETGAFDYSLEGKGVTLYERAGRSVLSDAKALNAFAAKTFVLLHLEGDHAPDTADVLNAAGVDAAQIKGYPYVFTLDGDGRLAAVFDDKGTEVRRDGLIDWYRGYDRKTLITSLTQMRDAALTPAAEVAESAQEASVTGPGWYAMNLLQQDETLGGPYAAREDCEAYIRQLAHDPEIVPSCQLLDAAAEDLLGTSVP